MDLMTFDDGTSGSVRTPRTTTALCDSATRGHFSSIRGTSANRPTPVYCNTVTALLSTVSGTGATNHPPSSARFSATSSAVCDAFTQYSTSDVMAPMRIAVCRGNWVVAKNVT